MKQEPWQTELKHGAGWTPQLQMSIIERGKRPDIPAGKVPTEVQDIIQACWKHSSHDRPSMREVVQELQRLAPEVVKSERGP